MFNELKTQPLSLLGILSLAWTVFLKYLRSFLVIGFLVYLPINFLLDLIPFEDLSGNRSVYVAYVRINQLLQAIFGIFAAMAVIYFVRCIADGKTATVAESFAQTFKKWGSVIWVGILSKLAILGFTLLLIIPGVIYAGYYIFVLYAVILKDARGLKALEVSKGLVKGRWWKMIGYTIVIYFCGLVGYFVTGFISSFFEDAYFFVLIVDTFGDVLSIYSIVAMSILFIKLDASKPHLV